MAAFRFVRDLDFAAGFSTVFLSGLVLVLGIMGDPIYLFQGLIGGYAGVRVIQSRCHGFVLGALLLGFFWVLPAPYLVKGWLSTDSSSSWLWIGIILYVCLCFAYFLVRIGTFIWPRVRPGEGDGDR